MVKITKVYTRHGDKGQTSLVGGVRVSKNDARIEAYGTVDELSAQLGLLASLMGEENAEYVTVIRIQNTLFNVCTHLATDQSQTKLYPSAHLPEGEVEQLEQRIEKLRLFLDKHLDTDTRFGKTYEQYFTLHYNSKGQLVHVEEKADIIQRELELCGYFCIVTSEKMTASQALIHYKGRDMSEKLFQADKSFIGSKSMRVHSAEALSSKIFLEFVALIVRNRIYNLLKETVLRLDIRPNYMTVPAALRELEKIELVRRTGGRYQLDHAVSKRQKTILSAFGLNDEDVRSTAAEISKLLAADSQSVAGNTPLEDEDGQNENDDLD